MTDALHRCANAYSKIIRAAADILRKAQGRTDAETRLDIDVGAECMYIRDAADALKRELAEARALLERCVPYVLASTKKDGQTGENARAILADINGRRA